MTIVPIVRIRRAAARTMVAAIGGVCLVVLVGGCATVPPPVKLARTTVILLPDEEGHVGEVSLSSDGGSQKIDEAYASASIEGAHAKPSGVSAVGLDGVTAAYAVLLQAQPPKPRTFMLHFLLDRTVLTEESKAQLPAVLAAVRERKPTEITIFGHADATGSEKHNIKLSAERARAVANLLRKDDPSLDHIDVQYFGDRTPLVPSAKGPEPRNRRAEVMIL